MKRRWIFLVLTVSFLWLVVSRFTQLEQLKATLSQAQWPWLLAALVTQTVYFVVFSASYQAAFSSVDIHTRTRDLIPITLGSLFVNVVVPAGGAAGAALFTEDLARRGQPAPKTAAGVLLQLIADFTSFTLILIPSLVFLFIEHDLKGYEIVAAIILLFITVGLSAILLLGIWNQSVLQKLFGWTQRTANWMVGQLHRSLSLADDWAQKNAVEFGDASIAVANHPSRIVRAIAVAFLAHLLDIFTLYILFRAFNQPVGPGVLVTGYAIGILFWIVSITPQGIGVVEAMMALVFTSLGIPGAAAATIVLAFRGLTFWIPMLLGFLAIQRTRTLSAQQHTLTETWSVRIISILVALMGVINVLSAITPSLANRLAILDKISPFYVLHGGHLTAALSGFALLLLAGNLARRKRVAWILALAFLGISIVSHLVKGLDYEEALLAGALALLLWLNRYHFHARSDPPSVQQGLRILFAAAIFTVTYGVVGFFLLDRHYSVNFGFWAALRQTVVMFTQFYDPGLEPVTHFGRYFADSIYIVGMATFGYAAVMLVRPVFLRQPAAKEERLKARQIVETYGHSSLARYLLFDDKHYFFTPGGSVIGFGIENRIALALGDPIGPSEDLAACIAAFSEFCKINDWQPAYYQVLPEGLESYKAAGFNLLRVGDEAIVDLNTFTLAGGENKNIRTAVNKMNKLGYRAQVLEPPHPAALMTELRHISDEWLTTMHGTEKRFSLGWFDEAYLNSGPVMVIYNPEGTLDAFANIVTEYQAREASIDLMRHRREAEKGQMDFLFASLFEWAKEKGYATFNLGLSGLAGVGELPQDPLIERAMHYFYEHLNQFYNFKGLHEFKSKFHPAWSPRYLVYPGTASLLPVVYALIRADSGDNILGGYFRRP